jgi:hypothetical protein
LSFVTRVSPIELALPRFADATATPFEAWRAYPGVVASARAVALVALAVIASAGAVLADGSDRSAQTDAHSAVERTVKAAVYAAVRHRNYRRACRFATPRGRRRLLTGFNSASGPDFQDCPAVIAHEARRLPETVRRLRRDLDVTILRASATRARVRVAEGVGPFEASGHLALVRVDGRWRIDNSDLIPYGD